MQRRLAAPAQRHPKRRGHHRFRRILDRHVELLEAVDRQIQFIPLALLCRHQHHHQVGAHREVLALVANHHGVEVLVQFGQTSLQHLETVFAQGIHLAVKLATQNAVAQIHQGGPRVFLHHAP